MDFKLFLGKKKKQKKLKKCWEKKNNQNVKKLQNIRVFDLFSVNYPLLRRVSGCKLFLGKKKTVCIFFSRKGKKKKKFSKIEGVSGAELFREKKNTVPLGYPYEFFEIHDFEQSQNGKIIWYPL